MDSMAHDYVENEYYGPAKRFIPFSDGPRDCVGRNLATMNITAALATLLGHFSFRLADSVRA